MLEHQPPSRQTEPSVPSLPERSNDQDPVVEDYLDQVIAPLVPDMPYEERQEIRAELKGHLLTQVEALVAQGHERAEARATALKQFGKPSVVAKQWLEDAETTSRHARSAATRRATALALVLFGADVALVFGLSAAGRADRNLIDRATAPTFWMLVTVLGYAGPILCGLTVGMSCRGRSVAGTVCATALLAIPFGLLIWLLRWPTMPDQVKHGYRLTVMVLSNLQMITFWAVTGCAGAWLGATARNAFRSIRRRRVLA